jgi:hypothetical protein
VAIKRPNPTGFGALADHIGKEESFLSSPNIFRNCYDRDKPMQQWYGSTWLGTSWPLTREGMP